MSSKQVRDAELHHIYEDAAHKHGPEAAVESPGALALPNPHRNLHSARALRSNLLQRLHAIDRQRRDEEAERRAHAACSHGE
eukprot:546958-Prymnesium_polylepis.1